MAYGTANAGVAALQGAINLCYNSIPDLEVDRIYGNDTRAAVRAVQTQHRIKVDGEYGPRYLLRHEVSVVSDRRQWVLRRLHVGAVRNSSALGDAGRNVGGDLAWVTRCGLGLLAGGGVG
ncbi:peptidoglycan-binding domain-containing protein [Streptomyces sp. 4N124]|uniref:peptidoglycan-binding domain-containing protein n=1 Tax=Streptomyces sp. 4N124 TaxID=3457420 RepID=UPI003FD1B0C8